MILAGILLTSCTRDDYMADHNAKGENPLVTESREFFETIVAEGATKGILDQSVSWNPGEVTPRWEEAWIKSVNGRDYVMVPIVAEHHYIGRETAVKDSVEKQYRVRITQLLSFQKSEGGGYSAAYLTLVPSKGYYTANRNSVLTRFLKNEGYYGNFTGRVIYNDPVTFDLMGVDKVVDGAYEWGFSFWSVPSEESFWRNYRKMFKNVTIHRLLVTKGLGEYDEESDTYDGGEAEEIEVEGSKPGGGGGGGNGFGGLTGGDLYAPGGSTGGGGGSDSG